MARPNWEYIRVDVLLPEDPKLDGLSDGAKWTLICLWCHCGQHLTDGFVRERKWNRTGTPKQREQILNAGLAHPVSGGYQIHNYLGHQRSKAEVEALKATRAESGRRGGKAKARATALAKQELDQELEQRLQQTSSKSVAEAEAEADKSMADIVDRTNGSYGGGDLIDLIITELRNATGRDVDRHWAAKTRAFILDGRNVTDPAAYIRQAIRSEPNPQQRFLPLY